MADRLVERFREMLVGKSDVEMGEMALGSPAVHFATCVTIHNKNNEVERPVPNILQLRMSEVYEVCMALGVPCRMIVCKPRQVGCSTFGSHICYHHGMRWRSAGITISDKAANSQKLMLKVRDYGMVDRFPWGIRQIKDTSMGLSWTNGTRWEIDSAENWKAGIGDTRQVFHACLGVETPVVCGDTGKLRRLGDLAVGDKVKTHTGKVSFISYVSEQEKECIEVTFRGMRDFPLVATMEHRFWTRSGWMELGDICGSGDGLVGFPVNVISGDVLQLPFALPAPHRPQGGGIIESVPAVVDLTYALGRIVGLYLAEGHIVRQNNEFKRPTAIGFTVHEDEVERTLAWLGEVSDLFTRARVNRRKDSRACTVKVSGRSLAEWMVGLVGDREGKRFPYEWWRMGEGFATGMVHGYISGDGHCRPARDRRITVTSVRSATVVGLRDVLASLGYGWASIEFKGSAVRQGRNEKDAWVLSLCGIGVDRLALEIGKKTVERKRNGSYGSVEISDGYAWVPIVGFKNAGVQVVRDLEVEDEDHSYCILHGATHNSETAKWPKTGVKNDARVMAAVLPSISKGRSVVIAESTPEGANGWYYDTWQDAVTLDEYLERRESGEDTGIVWIKVFAAWYEFEEHQRRVRLNDREIVEMERTLGDREGALREKGISWEQLAWRRDMIRTECGGSEDIFDEYYPEDDVRCLKHDTLVPTARGMLPISSVRVGDKLSNGTVVAVSKTGYRPVHEVETSRGFRLECTYDHRLKLAGGGFVRAVDSVGSAVELAAPIFSEVDYVHEWVGPAGVHCRLPITEDWARLIGYYEGDGSFYKNQLSLVVGSKDEDMKPLLLDLWMRLFGVAPQERKFKHARCHELRAASSDYAALFDALGLTDTSGEWRKRKVGVPDFIWRCPKQVVREFLRGLFEADAHVRSRGTAVQFFSKHKRFCQDVLLLLLGFGVHGKLRPVTAKLKGKEYPGWQIIIYKGYVGRYFEEIGFLSARKQAEGNERFHVKNNGRKSEVLGMEDEVVSYSEQAEEREVWDLTMSDEPEFCANGIMVHNCFAVSGRPRFDVESLMAMERVAKGFGCETGHLVTLDNGVVTWSGRSDGGGDIQVWEQPREGCFYLVGCDPATGEDQTTGKNPDRTSVLVWRRGYFDPVTGIEHRTRLVARVRAPFFGDGDEVAGHILRLSRWYGGATVVIEVNMGIHIVDRCKDLGVPLYMRRVPSARVGTEVMQYGWKLKDPEQRRQAVDALAVAIREGVLEISCENVIHELKMFVIGKNGREEARGGEHDDDVLCAAMAWASITSASMYRPMLRRKRKPADWKDWKRVGSAGRGY